MLIVYIMAEFGAKIKSKNMMFFYFINRLEENETHEKLVVEFIYVFLNNQRPVLQKNSSQASEIFLYTSLAESFIDQNCWFLNKFVRKKVVRNEESWSVLKLILFFKNLSEANVEL